MSYEMFRLTGEMMETAGIDLVVCDEGHRLKNVNIKLSQVCEDFLPLCLSL